MTPRRWQQVKELFHNALALEPQSRAEFLERACAGHDSLRREIESLIKNHEATDTFIDAPAYEAAAKMLLDEHAELQAGCDTRPV